METILEIKDYEGEDGYLSVSGFEVVTSAQVIKLYMDNVHRCCENFGYFWCNDDPQEFIGAALLDVRLTDDSLNEANMEAAGVDPRDKYFEGGLMFVNLETSRGTLQFVAYNAHNGYYGHMATVQCAQLMHKEHL